MTSNEETYYNKIQELEKKIEEFRTKMWEALKAELKPTEFSEIFIHEMWFRYYQEFFELKELPQLYEPEITIVESSKNYDNFEGCRGYED